MDDGIVDRDPDLTSTIGDVLLSTKNDKTDANDSTPTSSTDAASSFPGTSLTVSEDPISSTSSDLMERDKLPSIKNENNEKDTVASKNLLGGDGDVDLLDMNIPNVSSDLISEDVEDIVQDLENLLGEPEPHHDFPTRRKEKSPFEETELLASLDDQLSKNVDSNLCPTTSNTQLPEKIEIVEEIESKNDETYVTEESEIRESSNIIGQTASEEQPVILEIPHSEEKPENIEVDDVDCRSDKLEVAPSGQSEEQIETETPQAEATKETPGDKPEENEVNTVSSSEIVTPSRVPSDSIEENIEDKEIQETEEARQSKDSLELTADDDIGSTEKTDIDSQNLQSNVKDQDNISEDLDSKGDVSTPQKIEIADSASEKSLETGEDAIVSEPVSEGDKDAQLVDTENFKELQSFITDPSEEVVPSDPAAEILVTPTEMIDTPIDIIEASTSFVDESICDPNPDLTPSSEEVIQETPDSLPEITDASNVTTDFNPDIPQTDVECDVNVTSSSNLEELEISELVKSSKESNEVNPVVFYEISECEQLVEPEDPDIVLNDQNVVNEEITIHTQPNIGRQKTDPEIEPEKQIIEQVKLTSSDESTAIVENSGSDSTETVSQEKLETLSENIKESIMENQVTCEETSTPDAVEQKLSPSVEIVPSEETTIEAESVVTLGDEPEKIEDLTEVKKEKLVTSDESGVDEQAIIKEDISTAEKAETEIASSTNQNTELIEEKLTVIPEQEPSKENLELQTRNHEIVKEDEAEDILGITEKYSIQSPPDGTLNKEETIEQESTIKSEIIPSVCKDDDDNKGIVSSVTEEQEQVEKTTVTEDISGIEEDEVMTEIKDKKESSIQEKVQFSEATTIEIMGEDVNIDSTEPVEENVEISCSVLSRENINSASPEQNSVTSESSEKKLPDLIKADFSTEVSCSISEESMVQCEVENIQALETENMQKTEDFENSSVEKLVPVNEEICVEKVIIYKHDCDSHKNTQSNIQIEYEQGANNIKHNTDEINEPMDGESEDFRIKALEDEIIQSEEYSLNFAQEQPNTQTENIPVQSTKVAVEEISQTPVDSSNSPQQQLGFHSEDPPVQKTDVVVNEAIQSQEDSLNSAEQQSSTQSENPSVQTTEVDVDEAIQSSVEPLISTQQQSRGQSEDPPVQKTEIVVDEDVQSQVDSSNSAQQESSGQPENSPVQRTELVVDEAIQYQVDSSNQTHHQSENTPVQKTELVVDEAVQSQVDSPNIAQQHSSGQSENTLVQRTEVVVDEDIQSQVDSSYSTQQPSNGESDNPLTQTAEVVDEVNQHSVDSSQIQSQNDSTAESENSPLQLIAELPDEEIRSPIDSSASEKEQPSDEIVEQNEQPLNTSEPSRSEDVKIDEVVEEIEKNLELNEQKEVAVVGSIIFKENEKSNQTQDVSSSDQQINRNIAEEAGELEMTCQPNSTILIVQASEESRSDAVPEQTMEDQTSAAVQSILENMLTEEKRIEKIIEKEEAPVVHSSYSSYEVQKAVQEIQCITQIEEVVEMPPEDIQGISSSEKPCNSETLKYESGCFEAMHVGDQNDAVEREIPESKITEEFTNIEPENTSAIENIEPVVSEEVSDENVETIQEIVDDLKNNPESVTQSSNSDQNQTRHAIERIEQQSPIQSKEESSSETIQRSEPVDIPSLDLSEESSSEEVSDEDKKQNLVSSSTYDHKDIKIISKNVSKVEKVLSKVDSKKHSPREIRHSSRISEKIKPHNLREEMDQPLSVSIDEVEREKPYSPKITIKPIKEDEPNEDKEEHKGSLKITITKQSDNTHSILKMCSPDFEHRLKQSENDEQNVVPKLVIKTSDTHSDQHSPKMSTRSSKQALPTNSNIRSGSPRITIKPIVKPESKETITSPLKITIKPIGKPEEFSRQQQRHSPKQSKNKTDDDHYSTRSKMMKSSENSDVHSPKVTIKPVKPPEELEMMSTPKITIKPIEKPEEARVSPKITIKPVLRPVELETEVEDEVKERIVLKINKGNLPSKDAERINRESRKRELEEDKSEKLAKIKLKFSKDGDAHIVHKKETDTQSFNKRQHDYEIERSKRFKADATDSDEDVKLIETRQSPIVISEDSQSQDSVIIIEDAKDPLADVVIPKPQVTPPVIAPRKRGRPRKVPLVVREEFLNEPKVIQPTATPISVLTPEQPTEIESTGRPKRSCRAQSVRDTLGIKPRKPSKPRGGKRGAKSISFKPEKESGFSEGKIDALKKSLLTDDAVQAAHCSGILKVSSESSPKKEVPVKEEPIKPIGLKSLLEAAIDQNIIEVIEVDTPSNSPKSVLDKIEEECVVEEDASVKIDKSIDLSHNIAGIKDFGIQKEVSDLRDDADCNKEPSDFGGTDAAASDVEMQPPTPVFAPPLSETSAIDINSTTDIAMFEEETRMSADASSRAQTPAKQVVSSDVVVEESQSSIQSTATTESGKISRRSRLEVHQDQDGSVFTADQLNEYYWGGNGPFMIQEQVAQFLGIKSFKRKYPGIPRRMVDMQERDYIRENGLASESMCDLGLTAVNSADILDIMYTDFQEKYEEFCRFQRDKQAKDLLNKQKALSLAANQEKSKMDILEQAVQSAAAYNANFNKTRREQRRACMDLQTMNIHYPKGKLKKINMPKIGHYPVAVVPGQFTDYYKEFTPTELNNLPLNTMLYSELFKILPEVSDSDSDSSGSDSDDSSSSGSESNSSCEENCKMCEKSSITPRKSPLNSSI